MSDSEGINAHLEGILSDSSSRVRSDGLVNDTKKEKPTAPINTLKNMVSANTGPENSTVVPVRNITRGVIPHRRLASERTPATIIYSKNIITVMIASGTGSKKIRNMN